MYNQFFVVGLGNPDKKYEKTRHNIGHLFIDYLVAQYEIKMSPGKGRFYFSRSFLSGVPVYLIKTSTYMNLSGLAVIDVLNLFNASPEELLIVCDDLNLPFENIRLRLSGSDGGQKGLRSVIESLGSHKFPRLRLGIGNNITDDAVNYVLDYFGQIETEKLVDIFSRSKECVEMILSDSPQEAMGVFNKRIRD